MATITLEQYIKNYTTGRYDEYGKMNESLVNTFVTILEQAYGKEEAAKKISSIIVSRLSERLNNTNIYNNLKYTYGDIALIQVSLEKGLVLNQNVNVNLMMFPNVSTLQELLNLYYGEIIKTAQQIDFQRGMIQKYANDKNYGVDINSSVNKKTIEASKELDKLGKQGVLDYEFQKQLYTKLIEQEERKKALENDLKFKEELKEQSQKLHDEYLKEQETERRIKTEAEERIRKENLEREEKIKKDKEEYENTRDERLEYYKNNETPIEEEIRLQIQELDHIAKNRFASDAASISYNRAEDSLISNIRKNSKNERLAIFLARTTPNYLDYMNENFKINADVITVLYRNDPVRAEHYCIDRSLIEKIKLNELKKKVLKEAEQVVKSEAVIQEEKGNVL